MIEAMSSALTSPRASFYRVTIHSLGLHQKPFEDGPRPASHPLSQPQPQRPLKSRNPSNSLSLNGLEHRSRRSGRPGVTFYGYRWYDTANGRWPSRDPIGERGGIHLYGMVSNNAVNWVDFLGLSSERKECDYTVVYALDASAVDLDKRTNGTVTRTIEEQVKFLQRMADKCAEYEKYCCCSKITIKMEISKTTLPDFDFDFKNGDAAAKEKEIRGKFKEFTGSEGDVGIIFTGQTISTKNSSNMNKVQGISLQEDAPGNPLGYTPGTGGIVNAGGDAGTLAHELGHFLGWHTNKNPMGKDHLHSGEKGNIMGYDFTVDNGGPNNFWCKLFCDAANKK